MHFDTPENHWILSLRDLSSNLVYEFCQFFDLRIVRIHLTLPVCFVCTFDHSCFSLCYAKYADLPTLKSPATMKGNSENTQGMG